MKKIDKQTKKVTATQNGQPFFQSLHMPGCPHFRREEQFLHTVKKKNKQKTEHILACKQSMLSVFPSAFKQCMLQTSKV